MIDAIDRAWTTGQWTRDDRAELEAHLGRLGARMLEREMTKDRKFARSPAKGKGLWHWMFGPIHQAPEPLPDSVSRLVLAIRDGERLDREDLDRLARRLGRGAVRALQAAAKQHRRGGGKRRR